jgi:hypothetical protein
LLESQNPAIPQDLLLYEQHGSGVGLTDGEAEGLTEGFFNGDNEDEGLALGRSDGF